MSEIPKELSYTQAHEWVDSDDKNTVTVGITDHAQAELGDLVFVDLPEVGARFSAGDVAAVVESVKAASDIYAPVDGEVAEVNEELADSPERINEDPYGDGWLFRLTVAGDDALDGLLDADAYQAVIEDEDD